MQNREGDFDTFVRNALAPLEYLFNNHAFCDAAWCWAKEIEQKVDEAIKLRAKNKVGTNNSSA